MDAPQPRNRITAWYETIRSPRTVLFIVVLALYVPTLGGSFMVDDHRAMRVMREYRDGLRAQPDVYRFLTGDPEKNRRSREAGWFAWWMGDDLKYQHMRPLGEWMLYAQYRVFGEQPLGYQLVSLAIYTAGVLLSLNLFRTIAQDERIARWAALIFAVAASHALPVTFISAQGDLVAMFCAIGAFLACANFVRGGTVAWLAIFMLALAAGLGAKEAMLPLAGVPIFCLLLWPQGARGGRVVIATVLAFAATAVWLGVYLRGGFGSNTSLMLDPIHDPLSYLAAAPGRVVLLLSTWVIPVNPFILEFAAELRPFMWIYGALGGGAVAALGYTIWTGRGQHRRIALMALFVLAFLPILVCTPPDDRVMTLPSIALAYLGAVWMAGESPGEMPRVRRGAFFVLVIAQAITVFIAAGLMQFAEREGQRRLAEMVEGFDRPLTNQDRIFVLNNRYPVEGLFMQDRLRGVSGNNGSHAALLADSSEVAVEAKDARTILVRAKGDGLLSGFVGRMGTTRGRPHSEGEFFCAGEYDVRIAEVKAGRVLAIEVRFKDPINSDRYRFFEIPTGAKKIRPVNISLPRR